MKTKLTLRLRIKAKIIMTTAIAFLLCGADSKFTPNMRQWALRAMFAFLYATLSACASSPKQETVSATTPAPYEQNLPGDDVIEFKASPDPWESVNRATFAFNDITYRYVFIPTAKQYKKLPKPITRGVGRFFSNLKEPISAINHLLQGDIKHMGTSIARFGVNSTIGLLGIFDVSKPVFKIEEQKTGFADTLTTWGVGSGPYVVIPFMGPSDIRGGGSLFVDGLANPIRFVSDSDTRLALYITGAFQDQASTILNYEKLVKEVDDPYVFLRELYIQSGKRDAYEEKLENQANETQ